MTQKSFLYLVTTLTLLVQGCASVYKPQNNAVESINITKGYRINNPERKPSGDHLVTLAFSGGGTRAAALSYGVLQELRDTTLMSDGHRATLLDEVDTISGVSGGSFTAAYYGLFGNEIFEHYENDFLRQSVQSTLIRKLFNPFYLIKSVFTGFDRTEMAIEYYDQNVFRKKFFADIPLKHRPYIVINATDLSTSHRFSFTQATFDLICSDLSDFSVARAVMASSAVPVVFPPVVLENHSDACDVPDSPFVKRLLKTKHLNDGETNIFDRYDALQNHQDNNYLHLVDGGISDNLGLRILFDQIDGAGGIEKAVSLIKKPPKSMLVILVNAEVSPEQPFGRGAEKPSISETVAALSATQIALYNSETIKMVKDRMLEGEKIMSETDTPVQFYFVDLSFKLFADPGIKNFFNSLPTSLELTDEQVDSLITAGRDLLRNHPEYRRFLDSNQGEINMTEQQKSCNRLLNSFCLSTR